MTHQYPPAGRRAGAAIRLRTFLLVGVALATIVGVGAYLLVGRTTPLPEDWVPRLQAEANARCPKSDCSADKRERMMALTDELAADAEAAGEEDLAELAREVHEAVEHWHHDCFQLDLNYSPNAQMSCDAMFDLELYGARYLLDATKTALAARGA